jgi:hypothetical protein
MDPIYFREAFQSLANYVEGRRFFARHGDGNVIISSLMPRTTKRPNHAVERTATRTGSRLKDEL